MEKVVEFLQENPVQYLATVGRDGKAKCRPFMFASDGWQTLVLHQQHKGCLQGCRKIRRLRSPYPAQLMHGSVCMEKQFLRTTCRQKRNVHRQSYCQEPV